MTEALTEALTKTPLTKTPLTDYLTEHWTEAQYCPDTLDSGHGQYCISGRLRLDDIEAAFGKRGFPWEGDVRYSQSMALSDRMFHWNNRHGRAAVLRALAAYELTGEVPRCPGHSISSGCLDWENLAEDGPCSEEANDSVHLAIWERYVARFQESEDLMQDVFDRLFAEGKEGGA